MRLVSRTLRLDALRKRTLSVLVRDAIARLAEPQALAQHDQRHDVATSAASETVKKKLCHVHAWVFVFVAWEDAARHDFPRPLCSDFGGSAGYVVG